MNGWTYRPDASYNRDVWTGDGGRVTLLIRSGGFIGRPSARVIDKRVKHDYSGVPRYVRKLAAGLFQQADDDVLPGGRMAFESIAAGTVVVAAREAGFTHSIDDIVKWARTPHERACAGARKVLIDLALADRVPPGRQDAVETVVERVDVKAFDDELQPLTSHLMTLADNDVIGAGTPSLTVAVSAVYAALKLLGDTGSARRFAPRQEVVDAVTPLVATTSKIIRYNCALVDAFEARHGTDDPAVVLEPDDEDDRAG